MDKAIINAVINDTDFMSLLFRNKYEKLELNYNEKDENEEE